MDIIKGLTVGRRTDVQKDSSPLLLPILNFMQICAKKLTVYANLCQKAVFLPFFLEVVF